MVDKRSGEPLDARIAAIARGQHGVITTRQLVALGLTRQAVARRAATGRLHRIHRGVYAVGHSALTVNGRRLAAVLALGDMALASHVTAAAMWQVRTTSSPVIDVTLPGSARRREGIRVHRRPVAADERAVIDGIRVTSLARTLVDLGDVVPVVQVRNAWVRAEQLRRIDMVTIDIALQRAGSRRGAVALREVLRVYDPRWEQTRSPLELAFLDLAATRELPEPEVNAWVANRFLVDALWRDERLVAEADGRATHDIPSARRDDARRDRVLRRLGYRVIRLSYDEIVHRPDVAAARVARALRATAT